MAYRVKIPYGAGVYATKRGQLLGDEIERASGFRSLVENGFIEQFKDAKTGEEFADHCYIVVQQFRDMGAPIHPGTFLDLRQDRWRNESSLLGSGMIRRATRSEAEEGAGSRAETASPPLSATTGKALEDSGSRTELESYKVEGWLREKYTDEGLSTRQIASLPDCNCSAQNVSYYLDKFKIPKRSRGRPKA